MIYAWVIYHIIILVAGIWHIKRSRRRCEGDFSFNVGELPTISIIIPAKNEEKVIGRCLDAFLKLDYPKKKIEIIVVEDGSRDRTAQICNEYARRYRGLIKFFHKPTSNGKSSALNFGLKHAKGELIGVFDADSVPESDILKRVAKYFNDLRVIALQGRNLSINADENMLTKLISYEDAVRYEAYIRGKEALELFVPLTGSCYFIKRNVLLDVGGWDDNCLSEDTELAAKLLEKGIKIKYAPDVKCWQENPSNLKNMYKQRKRWFGGTMEVALKYGRLLRRPRKINIDAELTLAGPFMFIPCLLGYLLGVYSLLFSPSLGGLLGILAQLFTLTSIIILFIIGATLSYTVKHMRKINLLWIFLIYAYWLAQIIVALHAFGEILLRRPKKWERTEKTGSMTLTLSYNSDLQCHKFKV
jgi:cellulose synthase/poly-beta-1,6-N-acetylglucosamine synthase-like glycosyltransferase